MGFEGLEGGLEPGEQGTGSFGGGFVLDNDVRAERLAVLWGEMFGELLCEVGVQDLELGRGQGVGYAAAEGAQTGDAEGKGWAVSCLMDAVDDLTVRWELVEEGEVGGDLVEVRGVVFAAQRVEVGLGCGVEFEGEDGGHLWRQQQVRPNAGRAPLRAV